MTDLSPKRLREVAEQATMWLPYGQMTTDPAFVLGLIGECERLRSELEIRKRSAERHRVCSDHSGKQPTDGECIMCFAERHERGRNRAEALTLPEAT